MARLSAASRPVCANNSLSIIWMVASNSLTLSSNRNSPTTPAATMSQPISEMIGTHGRWACPGLGTRNPKVSSERRCLLRCTKYSESSLYNSWNISGASRTTPKPTKNVEVDSQEWYHALPSERNGRMDSSSVRMTAEETSIRRIQESIRQTHRTKIIILIIGLPLLRHIQERNTG